MNYIIPPINLTGKFKLKEPLTTIINEFMVYTVTDIRSLSSLLEDGYDIQGLIYDVIGLTENDYINDLENKVPIVTLTTEGGAQYNIPASYFSYVPQISGEVFINKSLIVNLGYVPNQVDVDFITNEVTDLVTSMTGLETVASIEEISGRYIVDYTEYDRFELERQNRLTNNETCSGKLNKAYEALTNYKKKIKILLDKINFLENP